MSQFGIESFSTPERVEFDPTNQEHVLAVALMQFHGRQHPTLRFKLNPAKYKNVYSSLIDNFLRHAIPENIQESAKEFADSRAPLLCARIIDGCDSKPV